MNKQTMIFSIFLFFRLFLGSTVAVAVGNGDMQPVKGTVSNQSGKPVPGVVVTDGVNFVQTDEKGEYALTSDLSRSRFVYLSVPAAYEIPATNGIADGFYRELKAGDAPGGYHFTLTERKQPAKEFVYIAISDPQVMNEEQLNRFCSETVPDLKQTVRAQNGKEVYGMVLGDLVWDAMHLYEPYKKSLSGLGITFFQTIGNHDFNLAYKDRHNMARQGDGYAESEYENMFGPVNYSFNVGDVHVIALKSIDYTGHKKYTERLGKEQLEWLKKDLSYVKPGTQVFVNMHAPAFNTTDGGRANIRDARELLAILAPYQVNLFEGHTHYFENREVTPTFYEHNIGAACGAWWAGHVNRCGAPNGYLVVNVKGNDVKWQYKATAQPVSYRFRLYAPGTFETQAEYVVANIWDWDSAYRVQWYEDDEPKGPMERFDDEDQAYITMHGKRSGYRTRHLFRCRPSTGAKNVRIEVVDRFGKTCSQTLSL